MKQIAAALVALPLMVLPACESGPSRNVATGAGVGAVAGGIIGVLAGGDDGRNAAIGAAVGAIAGGAVGAYMDEQERKLREQTAGTGIGVDRQGDQIYLTMPSNVTFSVNSATIQPNFYGSLNDVAATLVDYPSTAVDIIGHASADGPDDYNLDLSKRRAESVKSYLQGQGVISQRLYAIGMGETQPIADNSTETGRAANRRVEIVLTPVVDETA